MQVSNIYKSFTSIPGATQYATKKPSSSIISLFMLYLFNIKSIIIFQYVCLHRIGELAAALETGVSKMYQNHESDFGALEARIGELEAVGGGTSNALSLHLSQHEHSHFNTFNLTL